MPPSSSAPAWPPSARVFAAIGVGNVFGSFLESALRNPGAADSQQGRLFIGFAAAELLGLLAFVVAMILIFVA
jgi:F-type H+-transporting ATPase subunit c